MYLVYKGYYNYILVESNTEKEAAVALAKTLDGGSVWDVDKEDFIFDWGDIEENKDTNYTASKKGKLIMDYKSIKMAWTEVENKTVYAEISSEDTKKIFVECGELPRNDNGDEDWTNSSGELQFMIGDGKVNEILLFPVYDVDENTITVGDFVNVTDLFSFLNEEALEIFRKWGE